MLDQHTEKKIKDPAVARLFDTCRFAGRKARMIGLLARAVTISVRDLPAYDAFMLDWDTRNNDEPYLRCCASCIRSARSLSCAPATPSLMTPQST